MEDQKLLFVYNAGSDLFSSVSDMAHKFFSPETYQCHLCALTFGKFSVKKEWKSFIDSLSYDSVFLHRNQFFKKYNLQFALPAVFLESEQGVKELISKQELENCITLEDLENLIGKKMLIAGSL